MSANWMITRWRALAAALAAAVMTATGAATVSSGQQTAGNDMWQVLAERPANLQPRAAFNGPSALARFNRAAFDAFALGAPAERDAAAANGAAISIPMPDGSLASFTAVESSILAPELAAAFPNIRTFVGQGVTDRSATARFGWTDEGFHAIVLSEAGTTYVARYDSVNTDIYASVNKGSVPRPADPFICSFEPRPSPQRTIGQFPITNGTSLRTYRLALAATGEYTTAAGGLSGAVSRITASMNRVNGIYERELAVRMMVSTGPGGNPTQLIYTNGSTDPYDNFDGGTMLGQNQANIDAVIGNGNYDIGHVFSTGGGGVAILGSVCETGWKAQGVTGLPTPTGDAFDVDYVSHEVGHQFAGNHTFNSLSGNCAQRNSATATEVGSGSTIQAYAGICSPENLQPNSNDYFTFASLDEMTAYITSGQGASCGTVTATGNTVPTVSAGSNYTIPISTPFTLTATGSDPDGDALTFDWEQHSPNGASSNSVASASTDNGNRPIMRSYSPTTSPMRTIPKLTYIQNNANTPPQTYACAIGTCLTGEILPTQNRAITFHVTARDNRAGAGAISTASMIVTSTTSSGPFVVTAPNSAVSIPGGGPTTVTWDVAGTTAAPVSAANVRILLSTDGGNTFPTVLLASTPNDGSQSVNLPAVLSSTARIKVEAVGNIFFDMSNANFTITTPTTPAPTYTDPALVVGTTAIKALHAIELRDAINAARARYGLSAQTWAETITATTTTIKVSHITEMRTALAAVYAQRTMTPPTYTNAVLSAGASTVKAVDIAELRSGVTNVW